MPTGTTFSNDEEVRAYIVKQEAMLARAKGDRARARINKRIKMARAHLEGPEAVSALASTGEYTVLTEPVAVKAAVEQVTPEPVAPPEFTGTGPVDPVAITMQASLSPEELKEAKSQAVGQQAYVSASAKGFEDVEQMHVAAVAQYQETVTPLEEREREIEEERDVGEAKSLIAGEKAGAGVATRDIGIVRQSPAEVKAQAVDELRDEGFTDEEMVTPISKLAAAGVVEPWGGPPKRVEPVVSWGGVPEPVKPVDDALMNIFKGVLFLGFLAVGAEAVHREASR